MYDYKLLDEIKSEINRVLQENPDATFEQEVLEKKVGIRNDSPKFRLHLRWLEEKGLFELQDTPDGYIITPTQKGIALLKNQNFSFVRDNVEEDDGDREEKQFIDPHITRLQQKTKWIGPLIVLTLLSLLISLLCLLKVLEIIEI